MVELSIPRGTSRGRGAGQEVEEYRKAARTETTSTRNDVDHLPQRALGAPCMSKERRPIHAVGSFLGRSSRLRVPLRVLEYMLKNPTKATDSADALASAVHR